MEDDDILKEPDEPVEDEIEEVDGLNHEVVEKKKKDLIDDDTVSLEDEVEDELEEDEEPFDDVNPI